MQNTTKKHRSPWNFLALNQPIFLRLLHIAIATLVITQIINSNAPPAEKTPLLLSPLHFIIGFSLLILSIVMCIYCYSRRGLRYFYPYFWGDTLQIRQDIRTFSKLKLPEANPRGLAACVQGLGLLLLCFVALSGTSWFILWQINSFFAPTAKNLHETLTGGLEIYLLAHGSMGIIHFFIWCNNKIN